MKDRQGQEIDLQNELALLQFRMKNFHLECVNSENDILRESYLKEYNLLMDVYFNLKQMLEYKPKGKIGRPSKGTTKKISVTMPDYLWGLVDSKKNRKEISQSELFREMVEFYLLKNKD